MWYGAGVSRGYRQYCGVARALELVGDRWTLLLVRELLSGPKRFTDLVHGVPEIPRRVLVERLQLLEQGGVVRQRRLRPPAGASVYELTPRGDELRPIVHELARWGAVLLGPPRPDDAFRATWLALNLEWLFDPAAVEGEETIELTVGGEQLHAEIDASGLRVLQGPAPGTPDLTLVADTQTFLEWGTGRLTDAQALARGMEVTGGVAGLERWGRLFGGPREASRT